MASDKGPGNKNIGNKGVTGIYLVTVAIMIGILVLILGVIATFYFPAQFKQFKIGSYQRSQETYCRQWGENYLGSGSYPKWEPKKVPAEHFIDYRGEYDEARIQESCSNPSEVVWGMDCIAKEPTDEYCASYLGIEYTYPGYQATQPGTPSDEGESPHDIPSEITPETPSGKIKYGVELTWWHHWTDWETFDHRVKTASEDLGVDFVRDRLSWDDIETTEGTYNWARWNERYRIFKKYGLEIMATVEGAPSWARTSETWNPSDPKRSDLPDEYFDEYLAFLRAAVKRYGDDVFCWEIWNEVDYSVAFSRRIEAYAPLLKQAYEVVKEEDPTALVSIGGLNWPYSSVDDLRERVFENPNIPFKIGEYTDIINYHVSVRMGSNGDPGYKKAWYVIESIIEDHPELQDKPIYLTEFNFNVVNDGSEEEQAQWVRDIYDFYKDKVDSLDYWHLDDSSTNYQYTQNGLINYNGQKKPAYYAYKEIIEQSKAAAVEEEPEIGNLIFKSGFEDGVYLDPPEKKGPDWVQYIRGADGDYDWTDDFPSTWKGGNRFSYHGISLEKEPNDCIETRIDNVIGHDESQTRALYMATKSTQGGEKGTKARNQYDTVIKEEVLEEAYVKYRIKLQDNLEDVMKNKGSWRFIMEWLETGVDYRWNINIRRDHEGKLHWGMWAQLIEDEDGTFDWEEESYKQSPELIAGEWALLEVYWKHSTGDDGLIWFKVNGEKVLEHRGRNMKDSILASWCMFKIYVPEIVADTGVSYQWVDDVEIYSGMTSEDVTKSYFIDFEDASWKVGDGTSDGSQLNLDIPNHFVFEGDGGAKAWIEQGSFCYSGSKCIGMELTDVSKSRRNAFSLLSAHEWLGDAYTVEAWYYLPAEWKLQDSSWYTIHAPMASYPTEQSGGAYQPYYEIMVSREDKMLLFYRDVNGKTQSISYDFSIPKGRWFKIEVYVIRHLTGGVIKVWIDGTKIFDETGITTKSGDELTDKGYFITPAKIYHSTDETLTHKLWIDDLRISAIKLPEYPLKSA